MKASFAVHGIAPPAVQIDVCGKHVGQYVVTISGPAIEIKRYNPARRRFVAFDAPGEIAAPLVELARAALHANVDDYERLRGNSNFPPIP